MKYLLNILFSAFLLLFCTPISGHNLVPNKIDIVVLDSSLSIHAKCINDEHYPSITVFFDTSKSPSSVDFERFNELQIIDVKYSKGIPLSIRFEVNNKAPSSIQIYYKNEKINWLEKKTKFVIYPNNIKETSPLISTVWNYFLLGIEHILIGYDHLLFILGLLFIVYRKSLLITITAFTLAHSLTLALAIMGWIAPLKIGLSPLWVEAMIAGSILILATEIRYKKKHTTRQAVFIAFSFGLLHGLGFAGVLSEIGLPWNAFWKALVSFNIGVEVGQLIFIAILLLLYPLILKITSPKKISRLVSLFVGIVAAFWLIERTCLLIN